MCETNKKGMNKLLVQKESLKKKRDKDKNKNKRSECAMRSTWIEKETLSSVDMGLFFDK